MHYTTEVLDRRSGELVSRDLGLYLTVTELGQSLGVTPRQIRKVLHVLGLAMPEGSRGNYWLTFEAVRKGYGKRIDRPKTVRHDPTGRAEAAERRPPKPERRLGAAERRRKGRNRRKQGGAA